MSPKSSSVSVVIPCYNHARFLVEAIESVLNQTCRLFEIVVVDDGSTDETATVVANYPGVRLIRQSNQGLSAARNAGLRASEGRYVVFLDADDRLLPDALEIGIEALASHPCCSFVFGRCRIIAKDGSPVASGLPPHIESQHYVELLRDNYIWNPAQVMYRREALERFGAFNTNISPVADYELYLRVTRNSDVYDHNTLVAEYRQHGENMSCDSKMMLKTTLAVLRSQWDYVKGNRQYEEAYSAGIRHWQEFYGERLVNEVRAHVRARRWKRALLDMLALAIYYPKAIIKHAGRKSRRTISRIKNQTGLLAP